ncbi:MAG: Endoribonuclease YbeY [Candidatus Accumulibacter sp. BA-94]|uniref:rRNA maturation RNase YbeY n=1 Tax=Accumulibacter sp. TaxID=2053492 RepID=UPI00044F4DBC|nr:rRNA maturation RNase YbeY [Accumulibacter sp.]EXI84863.1 MAG: Endoribonuclease YbeY [Candidatus Accumulibacter sp. BA-94]MBL8391593.1 rRNA maturation RNase YbeY [Accumulibacter sp.]HRD88964.1 rRNA maturation RNase YbeY [Accumulibacter sp.]
MAKRDARGWQLTVQYAVKRHQLPRRKHVRRWLRVALTDRGTTAGEVTVRFVGAGEGRRLNAEYRGGDRPTNVLSFAYDDAPRLRGDLVVCAPVVRREADEQGKSLRAHCAHLVVHGMLHLLGYDHEGDAQQAARMEAEERRILAALGHADPYGEQE